MNIPEMDIQLRIFFNQKDHQVNAAEILNVKAVACIYVSVKNNPIHAIVDLRAGMSIIFLNLLKQFQIKMDANTDVKVKGFLESVKGFCDTAKIPIYIKDTMFIFIMFVLKTLKKQQIFLLENDWYTSYVTNIDYKT